MDELEAFLSWWGQGRNFAPPIEDPIHFATGVTAVTLFRQDQFQVQMIIIPPNHMIPAHTHPDVDSFEVYLAGDITFYINGEIPEEKPELGAPIRVRPHEPHGGEFGPKGGTFLSVQHWLNGVKPSSVGKNWAEDLSDADLGYARQMH